jgi:nucleoside-diphosphate-sugar epimerase
MGQHTIIGAGPIGSGLARRLAERGESVTVVTRSGTGPQHPAIRLVAADASDTDRLSGIAAGSDVLYNCANPANYNAWPKFWPPLAAAILTAAERSGAVLVTMSNLYMYGPVDRPMTEDMPMAAKTVKGSIRAGMWRDALAAHRAGRVRATEVRASDYIESNSLFSDMVAKKVLAGKKATVPANVDVPHSYTAIADAVTLLSVVGGDERAWGRPWHVPTNPALSIRDLAGKLAAAAGLPAPKVGTMPAAVLFLGAAFDSTARAFLEVRYQHYQPFVLDSSAAEQTFGLRPTPLSTVLGELVASR